MSCCSDYFEFLKGMFVERHTMRSNKNKKRGVLALLHERFRQIQLKTYFASNPYGNELSLLDIHILIELDSDGEVSQTDLVFALGVHKVNLSRALNTLLEKGLVKSETNPRDSRSKLLSLTTKGRLQLRQLDHRAGALMEQFCWFMSQREQTRLAELWGALCDGLRAPIVRVRPGIHPLLVPGRRHSRGLGLLGTSVFGVEGLSSLEWHVLTLVETGRCESPTSLASILNIHATTVLGVGRRLISEGLLNSRPDSKDRRGVLLSVTPLGKKLLERVESQALTQLERASSHISAKDLQDFIELLHRHGADLSSGYQTLLGGGYWVGLSHSEEERGAARSFIIRELVRQGLEDAALEYICHPTNVLAVLTHNDECVAAVEISGEGVRIDYALVASGCPESRIRECIALVKNLCMKRWGTIPELRTGGVPKGVRDIW